MTDPNPDDDAPPEFPDPAAMHEKILNFFRREFPDLADGDEAELRDDPEE